jgi:hypothetical protein
VISKTGGLFEVQEVENKRPKRALKNNEFIVFTAFINKDLCINLLNFNYLAIAN